MGKYLHCLSGTLKNCQRPRLSTHTFLANHSNPNPFLLLSSFCKSNNIQNGHSCKCYRLNVILSPPLIVLQLQPTSRCLCQFLLYACVNLIYFLLFQGQPQMQYPQTLGHQQFQGRQLPSGPLQHSIGQSQLNQGNLMNRHLSQFSGTANSALFNAAQTAPNSQMVRYHSFLGSFFIFPSVSLQTSL